MDIQMMIQIINDCIIDFKNIYGELILAKNSLFEIEQKISDRKNYLNIDIRKNPENYSNLKLTESLIASLIETDDVLKKIIIEEYNPKKQILNKLSYELDKNKQVMSCVQSLINISKE